MRVIVAWFIAGIFHCGIGQNSSPPDEKPLVSRRRLEAVDGDLTHRAELFNIRSRNPQDAPSESGARNLQNESRRTKDPEPVFPGHLDTSLVERSRTFRLGRDEQPEVNRRGFGQGRRRMKPRPDFHAQMMNNHPNMNIQDPASSAPEFTHGEPFLRPVLPAPNETQPPPVSAPYVPFHSEPRRFGENNFNNNPAFPPDLQPFPPAAPNFNQFQPGFEFQNNANPRLPPSHLTPFPEPSLLGPLPSDFRNSEKANSSQKPDSRRRKQKKYRNRQRNKKRPRKIKKPVPEMQPASKKSKYPLIDVSDWMPKWVKGKPTLFSTVGTEIQDSTIPDQAQNQRKSFQSKHTMVVTSQTSTIIEDSKSEGKMNMNGMREMADFIPEWISNDLRASPQCAKRALDDATYCDEDPEYPGDVIHNVINDETALFANLSQLVDWSDDKLGEEIRKLSVNSSPSATISFRPKFRDQVCETDLRTSVPIYRAMNYEGEWKIIVRTENRSQVLLVEECSDYSRPPCGYIKHGTVSECVNKYTLRQLMAFSDERGLHVDRFLIPVSCNCLVRINDVSMASLMKPESDMAVMGLYSRLPAPSLYG